MVITFTCAARIKGIFIQPQRCPEVSQQFGTFSRYSLLQILNVRAVNSSPENRRTTVVSEESGFANSQDSITNLTLKSQSDSITTTHGTLTET